MDNTIKLNNTMPNNSVNSDTKKIINVKQENIVSNSQINNLDKINKEEKNSLIQKTITNLNDSFRKSNIEFDYDSKTDFFIVKRIDSDTKKIIYQFPSKEFLERIQQKIN